MQFSINRARAIFLLQQTSQELARLNSLEDKDGFAAEELAWALAQKTPEKNIDS